MRKWAERQFIKLVITRDEQIGAFLFLCLLSITALTGEPITAPVISVADGDTVIILFASKKQIKVRFAGSVSAAASMIAHYHEEAGLNDEERTDYAELAMSFGW